MFTVAFRRRSSTALQIFHSVYKTYEEAKTAAESKAGTNNGDYEYLVLQHISISKRTQTPVETIMVK